jgi:4-aminobutyrate aminotransferase and related aminotransferases
METQLKEIDKYLMTNLYPTHRIFVKRAEGAFVYDIEGRRYLDFMTVVTTATLGHNFNGLRNVLSEVSERIIAGNGYNWYTEELLKAAKLVIKLFNNESIYNKVHFKLSGSEGIELAIKIAKRYTKRNNIAVFMGGYHGRTYLTGVYHGIRRKEYGPLPPGIMILPFPYKYRSVYSEIDDNTYSKVIIEEIENYIKNNSDLACLISEPIQGIGGIVVPPSNFFALLSRLLKEYGILLIMDEIQTGMGRTGKVWGFENFNVNPDIVVAAKGMTGGLPASAVVTNDRIAASMQLGDEHSTFGASALIMSAVAYSIEYFLNNKDNLLSNVKVMGDYSLKRLNELREKHPIIGDVRGMGLMIGIELIKDRKTKEPATKETNEICLNKALKKGLLVVSSGWYGNVIRFAPPFIVNKEQIDEAIDILDKSLYEIERESGIN